MNLIVFQTKTMAIDMFSLFLVNCSLVLIDFKGLGRVSSICLGFVCQSLSIFVRIDAPMHFLEVATSKTLPKFFKNLTFRDFSKTKNYDFP